ncbi:hypothetical protein [Rhizobium leguminosarum]|uniref:hypothetical protein n=1 Tax=Rhizobium leguminosarum TaxID=384 RepID=UPI003F5F8759
MDEAWEVDGAPVVTDCDATEVFELVEAALDEVSSFYKGLRERQDNAAVYEVED